MRSATSRALIGSRAFGLPVLTRVAVERADRGDALRRRALRRVDHDQLFHQAVVGRFAVRLEHEHVRAADALAVTAVDLAVRERRQHDFAERHLQVLGDLGRQLLVPAARHEDQPLLRDEFHQPTAPPPVVLVAVVILAHGAGHAGRNALHELPAADVVGHDRAGTRLRPVAELDRRDERRVDARVHAVADRGAVLVRAVVVRGDRARAKIRVSSDVGVADVGEVRHLGALADLGVLHLDVGPDLDARRRGGCPGRR